MATEKLEGEFEIALAESQWDKVNDKPCIKVIVTIEKAGAWYGKRLEWTGWMTEAAIDITAQALVNLGWDGKSLLKLEGLGSTNATAKIEEEEGRDGRWWPRIKFINKLRGVATESALTEKDIMGLDVLLQQSQMKKREDTEREARERSARPAPAFDGTRRGR
jgi:hypothetical protein